MELKLDDAFLEKLRRLVQDDKDVEKHVNYAACMERAEEMGWHVYGRKPERLLKRARPREDPAITIYRLESYEPVTKPVCKKALAITHKIFDSNLHSIRFDESNPKAKKLKDYSLENYPRFNSVVNYLANFVLKKMIGDPNAVLLVQPFNYSIPGFEAAQPIVSCYSSKDVHLVTPEYYLLFDSKSEEGKQKIWHYTYVEKSGIFKLALIVEPMNDGSGNKMTVIVEDSYVYNFKDLPVWSLGGEYSDEDYGVLDSYFDGAVPAWNEAINDHSDVTGAYRLHLWPQKWELMDECDYHDEERNQCNRGVITSPTTGENKACPACRGSGYRVAKSPYETHAVTRDKLLDASGNANLQIPFGYVTVPVEATKMLEEKSEKNLTRGLAALNMDIDSGLNQSGKAKEMDRTELNQFLQRIADQCFDVHLTNIYYFFTLFMFGVESKGEGIDSIEPEISKPTQFDIYSSLELTDQFAKAKTAKLNSSYLSTKQAQLQSKEFSTDPILLAKLTLELSLDPLSEVNSDEVSLKLNTGTITKETAIIHDNIKTFITRALEEDKAFAEKPYKDQVAVLMGFAAEVVQATKITIDTSAIEAQNQQPGNTTTAYARQPILKK